MLTWHFLVRYQDPNPVGASKRKLKVAVVGEGKDKGLEIVDDTGHVTVWFILVFTNLTVQPTYTWGLHTQTRNIPWRLVFLTRPSNFCNNVFDIWLQKKICEDRWSCRWSGKPRDKAIQAGLLCTWETSAARPSRLYCLIGHIYASESPIGTPEATQLVVSVATIYSHELIVIPRLGYFKFL